MDLFCSSNCDHPTWGKAWTKSILDAVNEGGTTSFIWNKYKNTIDSKNNFSKIKWFHSVSEKKPDTDGNIDPICFSNNIIERIDKTTQGNFTSWSHDYLAANLETKFLIIHAHEDTLVPIEQSISLSKLSDKINLLTLNLEKGKLSHGEQSQDILPIEYSIAPAYLMRALTKDNITIIVDKKAIEDTKSELVKNILLDEQIIFLEINENRILSKEEIQELLTKNQTN